MTKLPEGLKSRYDLQLIAQLIPQSGRVLDLGCGQGDLLAYLRDHKQIDGTGVDISDAATLACLRQDLSVMQMDVEQSFDLFADDSFDVVLLSQTITSLLRPRLVLESALRIGRQVIVSFPNMNNYLHLVQLCLGRYQHDCFVDYQVANNNHVSFCMPAMFAKIVADLNCHITRSIYLSNNKQIKFWPIYRSKFVIYVISHQAEK